MSTSPHPDVQCEVVFAQAGTMRRPHVFRPHHHEFWQLEILKGKCEILSDAGVISVEKSAAVVFSPHTRHGFRYPGNGEIYYSVKFHAVIPEMPASPLLLTPSPFVRAWISCCTALLRESTTEQSHRTLAGLLNGLFAHLAPRLPRASPEPPWIERLREFILANSDRSLTVQETAEHCRMTRGYLTTQFRKATGQTLKAAIDAERIHLSKNMLEYADSSITQVADQLGFPDLFSFSRFFKNHEGISPNQFRKARTTPPSSC